MRFRSKTFLRYILSYSVVLFLPLLILCLAFYSALMGRFTEEIADSNTRAIAQVQKNFDSQMEQIIQLSYLIQNDASLHPAKIGNDIMAARQAVSTLSTYKSITTLPEIVMVYAEGGELIFSNSGVLTPQRFFEQQYLYANHTLQDFIDTVAHPEGIVTWGSDSVKQFGGQSSDYITLFVAVQRGNISPKIRSIYMIPVKRLRSVITDVASEYGGQVYVFDHLGEMIMTDQNAFPDDYTAQLKNLPVDEAQRLTVDGTEYFLSSARSKTTGWQYVIAMPVAAVEAPLNQILLKMALFIALTSLAGGIAVYFFSVRHYKPLQQLRMQALAYAPAAQGTELEQVSTVLRQLSTDSDSYRRRLENNRDTLVQSCLSHILRGSESAAMLERAKENGVDLTAIPRWMVVAVSFSEKSSLAVSAVRSALMTESFGLSDAILCENPPDRGFMAILFPRERTEADCERFLTPLQEHLQNVLQCQLAFGVSLPCEAYGLSTAYQQAVSVLNNKLILGSSFISFFADETESTRNQSYYPLQELETLQWNLLQLDAEATTNCIHGIMRNISEKGCSFPVARLICFDIINVTLHGLYAIADSESIRPAGDMLERLAGFDTIQELVVLLEEVIQTACRSIRQLRSAKTEDRVSRIRQYVETNCFDPNFSIYSVAEDFDLTPSNLSHYFKAQTGQSISDYVQTLRRTEACRLLTETNDSIQAIGEKVGMLNVSSFIRNFKQQTGLTPGQYRSLHAAEKNGFEEL